MVKAMENNEIEVKIFDINPEQIKKKLEALGAKKTGESHVEVVMFDFPDHRITKNDEVLRVRKMHGKTEFVYKAQFDGKKKGKSDFKALKEYETTVESFDAVVAILKKLGLEVIRRFEKKRTSYLVSKDGKNVKVEIDTIPGVPTYLEVEANDEAAVRWGVQLLGFTMEQTSNKGIHEMWEKYYKGKTEVYFKDYPNKN